MDYRHVNCRLLPIQAHAIFAFRDVLRLLAKALRSAQKTALASCDL